MSVPVLNLENARRWFALLHDTFAERYRVRYSNERNGGNHVASIFFADNTRVHLALYVVEYGGEYVVTLRKTDDQGVPQAGQVWRISDTRHLAGSRPQYFCKECSYVHFACEPRLATCGPTDATPLLWDNPEFTDEASLFESLAQRVFTSAERELDDLLTIC